MTDTLPPSVLLLAEYYVSFLAIVVCYAFFTNRLRLGTQPIRCAFAALGEQLLADKDLPASKKKALKILLGSALDGRVPWIFAMAIPVYSVMRLLSLVPRYEEEPIPNKQLKYRYDLVVILWFISIIGMSPLAGAILLLETLFLIIVSTPLRKLGGVFIFAARFTQGDSKEHISSAH